MTNLRAYAYFNWCVSIDSMGSDANNETKYWKNIHEKGTNVTLNLMNRKKHKNIEIS